MRTLVVCICLSVGLATSQKDSLQKALKEIGKLQLDGLARMRSAGLTSKANLPASAHWIKPWMIVAETHARRLEGEEEEGLPDACIAACPGAKKVMTDLSANFMNLYMSNQKFMQAAQNMGDSSTPEQMKELVDALIPMIKQMMRLMFDSMSAGKEDYKCLATNEAVCTEESDSGDMFSPLGMANQFEDSIDCICDTCTLAQDAIINFAAAMMTAAYNVGLAFADGEDGNLDTLSSALEQMQKDILVGMCPLVGVEKCFLANPTECTSAFGDCLGTNTGSSFMGMDVSNSAELKTDCDKHGVSTEVERTVARVIQAIKIKNLDFDKVMKDDTLKEAVCTKVQDKMIETLGAAAYTKDDCVCDLSKGSVVATIEVTPVPGASGDALQTKLTAESTNLQSNVLADVKTIPSIEGALEDGKTLDDLTATAEDPAVQGGDGRYMGAASSLGMLCMPAVMLAQLMA